MNPHQADIKRLKALARELSRIADLAGPVGDKDGAGARWLAFLLMDLGGDEVREVLDRADLIFPLSDDGLGTLAWLKGVVEENTRLRRLSVTDNLTGLYNIRYFRERLSVEVQRVQRTESPCSLIMIDLDNFKPVNDEHGHRTGDRVLEGVGDLIRSGARTVDVPVRYGGDEFAVILPDTGVVAASRLAERLRLMFHQDTRTSAYGVTGSFGLATRHHYDHEGGEGLVERADQALYEAKRAGGDRIWYFEADRLKERPTEVTTSERDDLFAGLEQSGEDE